MRGGAGSCQIHLKEDARLKAAKASYPAPAFPGQSANTDPDAYTQAVSEYHLKFADSLQAQSEFTGPHFKDCVARVNFDQTGWVHVVLDGPAPATTYSYPASDVARVKTYR